MPDLDLGYEAKPEIGSAHMRIAGVSSAVREMSHEA